MKKTLVIVLCMALALTVLGGCASQPDPAAGDPKADVTGQPGASDQPDDPGSDPSDDKNDTAVDLSVYQAPANVVEIDADAEDPSNDNIRFVYDDVGRVAQCYYEIDGQQIYVGYTYGDGYAQIYAFMGDFVVADEEISLPGEYDASVGFASSHGYYFKGYQF